MCSLLEEKNGSSDTGVVGASRKRKNNETGVRTLYHRQIVGPCKAENWSRDALATMEENGFEILGYCSVRMDTFGDYRSIGVYTCVEKICILEEFW